MHLPIFWITCFSWSCLLQLGSGVLSLDFEISGVKGLRVHWKGGWTCLVPFSLSVDQRRSTKTLTWNNTTIRGNIYDFCLFHFFFSQFFSWFLLKNPRFSHRTFTGPAPLGRFFHLWAVGWHHHPLHCHPWRSRGRNVTSCFVVVTRPPVFCWVKNRHIMWIIGIYILDISLMLLQIFTPFFFCCEFHLHGEFAGFSRKQL